MFPANVIFGPESSYASYLGEDTSWLNEPTEDTHAIMRVSVYVGSESSADTPVLRLPIGTAPRRKGRLLNEALRPLIRPANLRVVSAPAINPVNGETDATTVPAGTRLVQLGAYASAEEARVAWASRLAMFGDYMVGKERIVQEAETGGRSFFRLRAMGFGDLADARAKAYDAVASIDWPGGFFRKDIAWRALS